MYRKLSDGTECRIKWAGKPIAYVDIGPNRYYFKTKRDLVEFSDMLNIFIKSYWEDFEPGTLDDTLEDDYF